MGANLSDTFPDQIIDPRQKGKDYILQYAKAAWSNSGNLLPFSFYFGNARMEEIRQYAMGKQSVNKYKKILTGQEVTDTSWMNIDWNVVPLIPKFREIAISTMMRNIYEPSVDAVDELSRTEQDNYINDLKVKLAIIEQLKQQNSSLANAAPLKLSPKEPQDTEELEIELEFGFKHNLAMQCEEALQYINQYNKSDYRRLKTFENLYDYGIAGYMTDIDENGNVIYKDLQPARMITSYCEEPDFSDAEYVGHIDMISVADLVPYFNPDQLRQIIESASGKFNNPLISSLGNNLTSYYDRFHVEVLSLRFIDYDIKVWKEDRNAEDNPRFFGKTDFKNLDKVGKDSDGKPKFLSQTNKVVRKCRWIIGTDFMYDFGLMENMNRKKSTWFETDLGVCLVAWNFNKMQFTGITERLIPIADSYMLTWFKLQNITNQLIPYIINIDYDALESVPFGSSGKKLEPMEIMDLIFQKYVAVGRSSTMGEGNKNGKIVEIVSSGQLEAFGQLYNDLNQKYTLMQQISGFNAATDGSTLSGKTLNGATAAMQQSTNSALYMIVDAEKRLYFNLCDNLIQKLQIAVDLGKVKGYTRALGSNSIKFLQLSDDIPLREFGLFLDEAPSQEEWNELLADINKYDGAGLLEPQDKILIRSYKNLKKAYMILSYKIKKRKEEQQTNALQMQQANTQAQVQSAQAAEQAKQQTIQLEYDLKLRNENASNQWLYETAGLKNEGAQTVSQITTQGKIVSQQIIEENKGRSKDLDNAMLDKKLRHEKELQYSNPD